MIALWGVPERAGPRVAGRCAARVLSVYFCIVLYCIVFAYPTAAPQVAALLVYYKVEGTAPTGRQDSLQQLPESPGARSHARVPLLKALVDADD